MQLRVRWKFELETPLSALVHYLIHLNLVSRAIPSGQAQTSRDWNGVSSQGGKRHNSLRQQKRGFANAESVAARLVPPQSQSATKSLEPPSFTDSETRISYCRGRDGLKTKGNAKLTVLGHNQEHGRTRSQCLNAQHEREIRMEGRCENVADARGKVE
ncbi:hypothetical protein ACSQ67_010314 [Phaseolus vulgaris]